MHLYLIIFLALSFSTISLPMEHDSDVLMQDKLPPPNAKSCVQDLDILYTKNSSVAWKGLWILNNLLKKKSSNDLLTYYRDMLRATLGATNKPLFIDYFIPRLNDLIRTAPLLSDESALMDSLESIISLLNEQYPTEALKHTARLIKKRKLNDRKGKQRIRYDAPEQSHSNGTEKNTIDIDALEKSHNGSVLNFTKKFEDFITSKMGNSRDQLIGNLADFIGTHYQSHPWVSAYCYLKMHLTPSNSQDTLFFALMESINSTCLPHLCQNKQIQEFIDSFTQDAQPLEIEEATPAYLYDPLSITTDLGDQPCLCIAQKNLLIIADKDLTIYDVAKKASVAAHPLTTGIIALCHTPVTAYLPPTIMTDLLPYGDKLYLLSSNNNTIKSALLSPGHDYLLTLDSDNTLYALNIEEEYNRRQSNAKEEGHQRIATQSSLDSVLFLNNHKCLVGNYPMALICNLKKRKTKSTNYTNLSYATLLNKMLLTVQDHTTLHLWDRSQQKRMILADERKIRGLVSFSDFAVVAGLENMLIYHKDHGLIENIAVKESITALQKTENKLFVHCSDNKLLVYSAREN